MGWEIRSGRSYYYRAKKIDGRVVREYYSNGPTAELIAQLDAIERERRQNYALAERQERERLDALTAQLLELDEIIEDLARATLMLAGYHRHDRGQWRKRREQKEAEISTSPI